MSGKTKKNLFLFVFPSAALSYLKIQQMSGKTKKNSFLFVFPSATYLIKQMLQMGGNAKLKTSFSLHFRSFLLSL
jgi:hypothetical protein